MMLFLLLSQNAFPFSCHSPQPIIQTPIVFDKTRIQLTQAYQRTHYGIRSSSINIKPQLIILHWTEAPTLKGSFQVFNPPRAHSTPYSRSGLPGELNVSVHFLVDRDGTIYQLMPDNWMARHVIGLNHCAIGIENVGGVHGKADLTEQQVEANAFLVCHLKQKYPSIREVIGHKDYLKYVNTPLWLEKDGHYRTKKTDPGEGFVKRVKQLVEN
ncbi:MAG: peptidoglycan recognition family protein [Gammaproteobacteria bacterium]|nr:peptidoglycan recognition family protein [Gammaproteobacteria bacterium]